MRKNKTEGDFHTQNADLRKQFNNTAKTTTNSQIKLNGANII